MSKRSQDIIDFWFEGINDATVIKNNELPFRKWFIKDARFDEEIRQRFEPDLQKAFDGGYAQWENSPRGRMALIILYDQFSRNMYRDTEKMYAYDSVALDLVLRTITEKRDLELLLIERAFFYLPLMHSEDRELQNLSVKHFKELVDQSKILNPVNTHYYEYSLRHAKEHQGTVVEFGRFPHRDALLGRSVEKS